MSFHINNLLDLNMHVWVTVWIGKLKGLLTILTCKWAVTAGCGGILVSVAVGTP